MTGTCLVIKGDDVNTLAEWKELDAMLFRHADERMTFYDFMIYRDREAVINLSKVMEEDVDTALSKLKTHLSDHQTAIVGKSGTQVSNTNLAH